MNDADDPGSVASNDIVLPRTDISEDELEKENVKQLKDRLRAKKLKVGGRKADLIQRLLFPTVDDISDREYGIGVTGGRRRKNDKRKKESLY